MGTTPADTNAAAHALLKTRPTGYIVVRRDLRNGTHHHGWAAAIDPIGFGLFKFG